MDMITKDFRLILVHILFWTLLALQALYSLPLAVSFITVIAMLFSSLLLVSRSHQIVSLGLFALSLFIGVAFLCHFTIPGARERYCADFTRKTYPTESNADHNNWWITFLECEQNFSVNDFIITIKRDFAGKTQRG